MTEKSRAEKAPKAVKVPKPEKSETAVPQSIDQYLEGVEPIKRAALEQLRQQLHALLPGATECFSYGLPALRTPQGKVVAGFAAAAKHCAFYPMSGSMTERFKAELVGFTTTKGSIHFQPDAPLPADLLKRIVEARVLLDA